MEEKTNPTIVASVIIPFNQKKYLLLKTTKDDLWGYPGGKIEKLENLSKGLQRETYEESGIIIIPKNLIGIYEHKSKKKNHIVNMVFYGEIIQGNLKKPDKKEILDIKAFNYEEIFELYLSKKLRPATYEPLEDYLFKNQKYLLEIIKTLNL